MEIGYDVPQVRIEIILATTSNMNQVIQRMGRVIRKHEGKDLALIYVIYVSDTKDDNVVELVKKAVEEGHEVDIRDILNETIIRKSSGKKKRIGKEVKQENVITDVPVKKFKLKDQKEKLDRKKKNVTEMRRLEKKIQKAYKRQ